MYYLPMTEAQRKALGIGPEGQGIAVLHGGELAGGVQLLPQKEPGVGWIGYYGLLPTWRGRRAFSVTTGLKRHPRATWTFT